MNCKPGETAVYVFDTIPDNIGALVRVVEPGDSYANDDKFYWHVESLGRPLKFFWCEDGKETGEVGSGPVADAPDAWLRPIRGLPGDDETFAWVQTNAFKAKEHA